LSNQAMEERTLLSVSNIRKSFGDKEILTGVSVDIHAGERLCLIGRSGSGKSTLLRCLNLLEIPNGGTVEVEGLPPNNFDGNADSKILKGANLLQYRAQIAMVFQHFELFPHLSALKNVALGPEHVLGLSRADAEDRARELLARVDLAEHADSYPATLSGGQKQRVAIARALAMRPKVILFDEPTSSLDPELSLEVLRVMEELAAEGTTMVVVTHEIEFARRVASRIAVFDQGQIIESGTPEEVLETPQNPRTQEFLKSMLVDISPAPSSTGEAE